MNHFPSIKAVAFDCFGTVFDINGIKHEDVVSYSRHVRSSNFTPYKFNNSWYNLKAHSDSADGIKSLQKRGLKCIAFSNGSVDLITSISQNNGIDWDHIVDLVANKIYKPHGDAYTIIKKCFGYETSETLMVTANPTFGDIEGSASVGMMSQVIRHGYPNTILELNEMFGDIDE